MPHHPTHKPPDSLFDIPAPDPPPTPAPAVDTSRLPPGAWAHDQAHPHTCPRCGTWILTQVPEDIHADPQPITDPYVEYLILQISRPTFTLHGIPGHHVLRWRASSPQTISNLNAPATECVVLAAHRCGNPPPGEPVRLFPRRFVTNPDGPPPF